MIYFKGDIVCKESSNAVFVFRKYIDRFVESGFVSVIDNCDCMIVDASTGIYYRAISKDLKLFSRPLQTGDSVFVHSREWFALHGLVNKSAINDYRSGKEEYMSEEMLSFCGKRVTLSSVNNDGYLYINDDNYKNKWLSSMFECIGGGRDKIFLILYIRKLIAELGITGDTSKDFFDINILQYDGRVKINNCFSVIYDTARDLFIGACLNGTHCVMGNLVELVSLANSLEKIKYQKR